MNDLSGLCGKIIKHKVLVWVNDTECSAAQRSLAIHIRMRNRIKSARDSVTVSCSIRWLSNGEKERRRESRKQLRPTSFRDALTLTRLPAFSTSTSSHNIPIYLQGHLESSHFELGSIVHIAAPSAIHFHHHLKHP